MAKIDQRQIALGDAKHISGADDRGREIEQTLERVRDERLAAAERDAALVLTRAREQAQALLAQAAETAQTIERDADDRREETLRQAREEGEAAGFQKGLADGHQQAQAETAELLASAQTLMQGAYQAQKTVLEGFTHKACELLDAVGARIVGEELTARPDYVIALIRRAIDELDISGTVRVVMNRDALRELRAHGDEVTRALDALTRLTLEGDPLLGRSEIYALTEDGSFDLSPHTQVTRCIEAIAPALTLAEPCPDGCSDVVGDDA